MSYIPMQVSNAHALLNLYTLLYWETALLKLHSFQVDRPVSHYNIHKLKNSMISIQN